MCKPMRCGLFLILAVLFIFITGAGLIVTHTYDQHYSSNTIVPKANGLQVYANEN